MPLIARGGRFAALSLIWALAAAPLAAATWTLEHTPGGVAVKLDGELVTEYLTKSGAKPILWPIIGPTGKPLTRAFPMETVASEEQDHPHQRSCWYTHGDVNGINFWSELPGHGTIEHRAFSLLDQEGGRARIVSHNDWLSPDGRKQCEDERRLTFSGDSARRIIDYDITLRASDGPLVMGDTKEGGFGVRVASTIRGDSKQGGRIVNSEAQTDQEAWGKRAPWVDYHGPVDGHTVGIAILNHPSSFRYPTYWHVRTYGLFVANPFGIHDFTGEGSGAFTVPAGQTLALNYRLVLHTGDEKEGRIAEAFEAYAKETREPSGEAGRSAK